VIRRRKVSDIELKEEDPFKIDAKPTKELFVFILVRDLTLRDAIGDLVDNCVDGAKRLRPDDDASKSRNKLEPDGKYDGLEIKLVVNTDEFTIIDNCGGISSELAREYAFRFGRPKDMDPTPGSVGQFGIGMKRALFKLGNHFIIESISSHSKFLIEKNIDEWIEEAEWNFRFKELDERDNSSPSFDEKELGTTIIVQELRKETITSFKLDKFNNRLKREIEKEQLYNIHRGLSIIVNDEKLKSSQLYLLESDEFQTAHWEKSYKIKDETSDGILNVEIYAGISEANTDHGGWYVFCNDRLIIGNNQNETTGWGEERKTPRYHIQYNRFRGYVFFNSDNADLLPWNTVKNNMNLENPYFQAVRLEMIKLMRPVINFLNWVHDERQKVTEPEERVLELALSKAKPVSLSKVAKLGSQFSSPEKPKIPSSQKNARIIYSKPIHQVDEAKTFFDVKSNPEVGSETFNYWYESEVEEE